MKTIILAILCFLLAGCAAMSPEQIAANAKDKNAVVACGQGSGPWGKVITVYVDTNKINDNNTVTIDGECHVSVTGTKAEKTTPAVKPTN